MWFFFCGCVAVGGFTIAAFLFIVFAFAAVTIGSALGAMWVFGLPPSQHPIATLAFVSIFGLGWWAIREVNERVRYRRDIYDWMHWTVRKGWQARAFIWICCAFAIWSTVWHANNFERLI